MLNIGNMDRRITIERKVETKKHTGSVISTWTPVATVWAEVLQQTASEFFTGYGEAETGTVIFRLWYLAGVTTADRVTYEGTAYNIKETKELGMRMAHELRCEAVK